MPLISTFGVSGSQAFGTRGLKYGGSAFFNAAGDYLVVPQSTAFTHTGNFTVETWVYPTNLSVLNLLWRQSGAVYMWISPSGQVAWYHGSNPWSFSASTVTLNKWNHIAVVRNAGTITIYVNGVGSGSVFNTATVVTGQNPLIGTWDGINYQFFGYLTNLRVAKQALYTSNFIPSGIPLTVNSQASTTTQLLLSTRTPATLITDSSANNFSLSNVNVTYADFTPFSQPYVTPAIVVLQSATVTPTTTAPSEGDTITFNVVGTNTPNGTYFYTIEEDIATGAVTSADFTSGALSGSFTINGNLGSFPLTVRRDLLTEGAEEFVVYVRKDSISGAILGTSGNIVISDTSLTPAFTVAPTTVEEPESTTFSVQNVGPDGTYFWTILNGTTANADFLEASGSFLVVGSTGGLDNGFGGFGVSVLQDRVTEGNQTFQVQVRSGSTSGPVILTSPTVTITDTSLTPAFTITPASINEGASGSFTVNNLGPAGTYYWTILNGSTVNNDFDAVSGSFTTSTLNGNGSFSVTPTLDYATDGGAEPFQVQIREGSITGTVLVTSASVNVNDTSRDITATVVNPTVTEGQNLQINVSKTEGSSQVLYWTIIHGTTSPADFAVSQATFDITTDGTIFIQTLANEGAETSEFFQVQIRRDGFTGPVLWTSGGLTIAANLT